MTSPSPIGSAEPLFLGGMAATEQSIHQTLVTLNCRIILRKWAFISNLLRLSIGALSPRHSVSTERSPKVALVQDFTGRNADPGD